MYETLKYRENINKEVMERLPDSGSQNMPTEDEVEAEAHSGISFFGRLFKVARCEYPAFIYMSAIFFFVSYVYSVSRDMKDAVIIERVDPASIPYLKMLVVLPANVLLIFFIQRVLGTSSVSAIFSGTCIFFGAYFCFYGLFLMSFREAIELDEFVSRDWFSDGKMEFRGLQWAIAVVLPITSWTSSLLYTSVEIWGTIVLQFLFFSFSNEIYTQRQSLRFVPLFLVFGSVALIASGLSTKLVRYISARSTYETADLLKRATFIGLGACVFAVYWIHKRLVSNILCKQLFITRNGLDAKPSGAVSFREGIQTMATSKLLMALSCMVIAYSVSVNMVESSFKSCMNQYAIQMGISVETHVMDIQSDIQLAIGGMTVALLLSSFSDMVRRKGFVHIAYIPPVFSVFGAACVFCMAFANTASGTNPILRFFGARGTGRLWMEQVLDAIVVAGFKLLKYSAFDVSKEALSMRINQTHRARFKGVYDGICTRLGKAIGAGIVSGQNILHNSNDVRVAAMSSLAISALTMAVWFLSVRYLSRMYEKSLHLNSDIDVDIIGGGGSILV